MKRIFLCVGTLILIFLVAPVFADEAITVRFVGNVSDDSGKPMAGVNILINRVSGAPLDGDISYLTELKRTTEANGNFDLPLRLLLTKTAEVKCELWFERKGFVRAEEVVRFASNTNVSKEMNVVLRQGEVLSGVIRTDSPKNIRGNVASEERKSPPVFIVSDGGWEGAFVASKDGAFEIYVPPGKYQFSVLTGHPFKIDGIKSGSTNLVIEPAPFVWSEQAVGKVFDDFWRVMDSQYSYFFLKTNVNWRALGDEFRPQAIQAKNSGELAKILQRMLTPLHDLHIWIETPDGVLGAYSSGYTFNGNGKATRNAIAETAQFGKAAVVGKSKPDGFGYLLILKQSNFTKEFVQQVVAAIDELRDAPGFIVDLRTANGGSEPFAQEIARRFCATNAIYAKSKYRNGPGHTNFTPAYERVLSAGENPFTKPVVCIIGPGAVSSGEGFVKMMKALPHVTTVGMPTRGASGNPKPFQLGNTGLTVTFSRWVDLMPSGKTFEGRGIPPDVMVDEPAAAYAERDPTLEKALVLLREKILAEKNAK